MPFQKGVGSKIYENVGRKGFELEQEQLEKMRKIVSKDLLVVEKIYDGKAKEIDFKRLQALQVRISKYLDKLHTNRQQTDITSGGQPIQIVFDEIFKKRDEPTTEIKD